LVYKSVSSCLNSLATPNNLVGFLRLTPTRHTRAMTNIITHRLVGYDRVGGRVAVEYDVPDHCLELAKRAAKVGADDPQAVLCHRLDDVQAHDLAAAIGAKIDRNQLNFYLEGFAEGAPADHLKGAMNPIKVDSSNSR
jgi:hypothetical protein